MSFSSPNQQQLTDIAKMQVGQGAQEFGLGQTLQNYITSGTLPPNAQALVDQNLAAQNAATRTQFSNLGLGDSTMATSALNQNKQASLGQTFSIEEMLAKLGQADVGLGLGAESSGAGTYNDVAKNIVAQDTALMSAIGNFGKALGGAAGMRGISGLFSGAGAGAGDAAGIEGGMGASDAMMATGITDVAELAIV